MTQSEFVWYIHHFITFAKPSIDSPVLLLLDNHTSHLSVEALDIAAAHGIHILSFPPHCSHRLQPLDVLVFGPTKTYYKSRCSTWQKNNANKFFVNLTFFSLNFDHYLTIFLIIITLFTNRFWN